MKVRRRWSFAFCKADATKKKGEWHIRRLTGTEKRLGGPCDTKTLCNKYVAVDLATDVNEVDVDKNACIHCARMWRAQGGAASRS